METIGHGRDCEANQTLKILGRIARTVYQLCLPAYATTAARLAGPAAQAHTQSQAFGQPTFGPPQLQRSRGRGCKVGRTADTQTWAVAASPASSPALKRVASGPSHRHGHRGHTPTCLPRINLLAANHSSYGAHPRPCLAAWPAAAR
jgi:hypothetical protein